MTASNFNINNKQGRTREMNLTEANQEPDPRENSPDMVGKSITTESKPIDGENDREGDPSNISRNDYIQGGPKQQLIEKEAMEGQKRRSTFTAKDENFQAKLDKIDELVKNNKGLP